MLLRHSVSVLVQEARRGICDLVSEVTDDECLRADLWFLEVRMFQVFTVQLLAPVLV